MNLRSMTMIERVENAIDLSQPKGLIKLQRQLARVKRSKINKIGGSMYQYYTPNARVEAFIDAFASDNYFVTFLSAANGVGKTMVGVNILAHLFWACGNKYFQGKLFRDFPYMKRVRIISDTTTIHEAIIPEMKRQFPTGRYESSKEGKAYDSKWITDTGWIIDLMTYEQDVKQFESVTVGLIWFDEPPPEDIYKASVARLRRGGRIFITATPLMGSAWMYDKFVTAKEVVKA